HEASGAEYFASLRTAAALERCEAAVVLIDASEPLTEQDLRIISMVEESGRALVLAYNKWDLLDDERREMLERETDRQLVRVSRAQPGDGTARSGWHVDRRRRGLDAAHEGWSTRVQTSRLREVRAKVVKARPNPVRG